MKIKVIIHETSEGGYWAEVPAIPGCATQGDNFEELLKNLYEAIEGCLSARVGCASFLSASYKLQPPKYIDNTAARKKINRIYSSNGLIRINSLIQSKSLALRVTNVK